VGHNLALKQRAKLMRRQKTESTWDGSLDDLLVDPGFDPEQQLAEDRRGRRLRSVLQALPERERRCLYLRAEGLRYRDIARTLDISLGSVAKSLTRALARLMNADKS
jgi:RNA polymerase sigma-70 factor (ECF subfamily)